MSLTVRPLDGANFFSALANRWIDADQLQRQSRQANYILSYLLKPQVAARCFIVEERYVDGDYLEDFATFYVSSFPPYDRYCRRLHFFDQNFIQADIDRMLEGDDISACAVLQAAYVGFIVTRPLPQAVVGRTVLRTYSEDGSGRKFPTVREYKPYLNGIPLPVRSLAFEEQDTSVAACATVALWSAFQKTHDLFGSLRARPATITQAANVVRSPGRALPSTSGLNPLQIGEAVRAVGLEPEFYNFVPSTPLASLLYAYLSAGIPLILGAYIEETGFHAITVVGYSDLPGLSPLPEPAYEGVTSRPGLHIDKLYLHDDGVGPFAVAPIVASIPGWGTPGHGIEPPIFLGSGWPHPAPTSARTTCFFMPEWVIVPAYHKIRVSYFAIHGWIRRLMRMFTDLRAPFAHVALDVDKISWDIRLTLVNEFKAHIRKDLWTNVNVRALARDSLPRFLWTATMHIDDIPSRLLVFDATDTERTCPLLRAVWLDTTFSAVLDAMFGDTTFESVWRVPLTPQLYDTLKTGRAAFL